MKRLKQTILVAIVMFVSSFGIAQETSLNNEQKATLKAHFKESFEKLDLSEEQKPKFKEISKKYALQIKTLKTSDQSKTAKEKEFKSIIAAKNKEMKALLSAEQYNIYEETQKERLKKLEHLKASFEKLDLSEEQQPKFKEITKKYALQMITLKSSDQSKTTKQKKFKSIIDAKNKEMKDLLSPEQYKIYEKNQKERLERIKENSIEKK